MYALRDQHDLPRARILLGQHRRAIDDIARDRGAGIGVAKDDAVAIGDDRGIAARARKAGGIGL